MNISTLPIVSPVAVSGANDDEPQVIIADCNGQQWLLVAVDSQTATFEAIEYREIGNAPRLRSMPLTVLQKLFGWGKKPEYDWDYLSPYTDHGVGIEVDETCEELGYMVAEPIWAERCDDIDWDWERSQMQRIWDYQDDRAANFGR